MRPAARRPLRRRANVVVAVVAVLGAVLFAVQLHQPGATMFTSPPTAQARPVNWPSAGVGEAAGPLGTAEPAPPGRGGYAFQARQANGGTPVSWDPCRKIHYVVSGTAPRGEGGVVASAFAEVSRLTGFRFVDDGATTEAPSKDRAAYQRERYGDRWAPVLVAWTDSAEVPQLAGAVIGLGGGTAVSFGSDPRTYVSGIVFLDKPDFVSAAANQRRAKGVLRAVVLHEIGHLLGLAHVRDKHSIMYPESKLSTTDYSAGDRRGLYALTRGPCAPEL